MYNSLFSLLKSKFAIDMNKTLLSIVTLLSSNVFFRMLKNALFWQWWEWLGLPKTKTKIFRTQDYIDCNVYNYSKIEFRSHFRLVICNHDYNIPNSIVFMMISYTLLYKVRNKSFSVLTVIFEKSIPINKVTKSYYFENNIPN